MRASAGWGEGLGAAAGGKERAEERAGRGVNVRGGPVGAGEVLRAV